MFTCSDCGVEEIIMYMVHNYLWQQYTSKDDRIVCPVCFGIRMGRRITADDLRDVMVNRGVMQFLDALYAGTVTYAHYQEYFRLSFNKRI